MFGPSLASILFLIIYLSILSSQQTVASQHNPCTPTTTNNTPTFTRTLHTMYNGGFTDGGNRSTFMQSLGACNTTILPAMFTYFRVYNINLEPLRQDPYNGYETAEFQLRTGDDISQPSTGRVYDMTYRDHSRFLNTRWHWVEWSVHAKMDILSSKGLLPQGSLLSFGMTRFILDGKDMCIWYRHRRPAPAQASNTVVYDLEAYSSEWGTGAVHGIIIIDNEQLTFLNTLTFPAYHGDEQALS